MITYINNQNTIVTILWVFVKVINGTCFVDRRMEVHAVRTLNSRQYYPTLVSVVCSLCPQCFRLLQSDWYRLFLFMTKRNVKRLRLVNDWYIQKFSGTKRFPWFVPFAFIDSFAIVLSIVLFVKTLSFFWQLL